MSNAGALVHSPCRYVWWFTTIASMAACAAAVDPVFAADERPATAPSPTFSVPVPGASSPVQTIWDIAALSKPPRVFPADGLEPQVSQNGLRALFFEGLPFHGQPTRVFAWYGVPKDSPNGRKLPAMVLVHGGGGTAFADWVKLWNERGYAAMAMDTCGCVPVQVDPKDSNKGWQRHALGGPGGWGGFDQLNQPVQDQWAYHAVADVILAHSLVRSFPEVDANRVGITGISWGGYLTCIAAGIDHRFAFAVPVYGCGFLGEDSAWRPEYAAMGQAKAEAWLKRWDPSQYLPFAKMPMLWVDGTNDFAYPLDSLQKSYRLPTGARTVSMRIRMPHGHGGPGENPEEILTFAESLVGKGIPLAAITGQGRADPRPADSDRSQLAWVRYRCQVPMAQAELAFTKDAGEWKDRQWDSQEATLDQTHDRAEARIPVGTRVYFFILHDHRELMVSSEHVMIESANGGKGQ